MFVSLFTLMCLFALIQRFQTFYQDDYEVTLDIVQLMWVNQTYLKNCTIGRHWYNRTTRIISGGGTVINDLGMQLKFEIEHYKFLSNEYRFFPMSLTINGCEERMKHTFGIKELLDKCTNVKACPFKKGSYYLRNCVLDYSKFPPHVPRGKYKMVIKLYNNEDFVAEVHVYSTVEDKKKWY